MTKDIKTTTRGESVSMTTSEGTISSKAKLTTDESSTAEQALYDIAAECDISIERFQDESLDDFAERLIDEIKERKNELDNWIDEIEHLDLDENEGKVS